MFCKICKEHYLPDQKHVCDPFFWIEIVEDDDWGKIRGYNHQDAAEKFAKEYDNNGDHDLVVCGSDGLEIFVRDQKDTKNAVIKKYTVFAEPDISYSAYYEKGE
ncbi:MAG: hypothetical protein GY756_09915 [bacterium]|nr:hypothetical protein [bacterium]